VSRQTNPEKQINFRHTVEAATSVELSYEMDRDSRLTEGFMHFPPGCNSLVEMRVLIGSGSAKKQVTPINNDFIALDDATYHFVLEQKLARKEKVFVEISNYDEDNDHAVSTIISYTTDEEAVTSEEPGPSQDRRRRV